MTEKNTPFPNPDATREEIAAWEREQAYEHGHRSIHLASLGIPEKPTKTTEAAPRAPEQR